MKGYKAFNSDWTCRGKQYTCPGEFEEDTMPDVCNRGMHFCEKLYDVFDYYDFSESTKIAEVEALGDINTKGNKACTNHLKIIREVPWEEVLKLCNTGNWNTGDWNTGDWNTGDWNTGNRNTGDWNTGSSNTGNRNTGDWNTGDCNTGDCNTGNRNTGNCNTGSSNTGNRNTGSSNTGNRNTGDCNTGNWNTGDWNTGDWNTGDWNVSNFNSGCFMTEEWSIPMFNKKTSWTCQMWIDSDARYILNGMPRNITLEWVNKENMTDDEKDEHPEHKTTGGYLKAYSTADTRQAWWDGLSEGERDTVMQLPNFDAEIFYECTGIKVKEDDR